VAVVPANGEDIVLFKALRMSSLGLVSSKLVVDKVEENRFELVDFMI
jgi:hypothetical protein